MEWNNLPLNFQIFNTNSYANYNNNQQNETIKQNL